MPRFVVLRVIVTEKEAERLLDEAAFLAAGTRGAALRKRAGMSEVAHGLKKAQREGTAELDYIRAVHEAKARS